ncbi:putative PD-(D/E)XK family member, (DUF4420) [Promicromonospora umidemergens]|uniref:PD-(D/E)XK family protein DUF4420 n=1 Tax=Promicromonospora umidemergens TaxID=629679 RepID=A0ABP8XA71_9MICO|nr:PD-(D/E)XK motif protein [Promicromonospora umidemergens]MCP2281622.1 putative PD-(D/E)XK family member, (DUF4420) [Promicromonospora umidemergens]
MTALPQLSPATLDAYLSASATTLQTVCSSPECLLAVDPSRQNLELWTPDDGTFPDLGRFARVGVTQTERDGGTWNVLTVPAKDLRYEAYGLLVAIIEAMRGGASFAAGTNAALTNLRALLMSRPRLSEAQQVGLVGELLAVRSLLGSSGPHDVLHWWLGPLAEQHDLALPGYDAEVKTTLSERRRHTISGTGQLTPTPGRPLWLVSVQLTRGMDGASLPGLVHDVRRLVHRDHRFEDHLERLGWHDEDADLYETAYVQRTAPTAYLVDTRFPAVTADRLHAVVPRDDLVDLLTYRVDVTDLDADEPGGPLTSFFFEGTPS